jgi:hypothetical protein
MNANLDLTPAEYIPLPKRASVQTNDIIEMERKATRESKRLTKRHAS